MPVRPPHVVDGWFGPGSREAAALRQREASRLNANPPRRTFLGAVRVVAVCASAHPRYRLLRRRVEPRVPAEVESLHGCEPDAVRSKQGRGAASTLRRPVQDWSDFANSVLCVSQADGNFGHPLRGHRAFFDWRRHRPGWAGVELVKTCWREFITKVVPSAPTPRSCTDRGCGPDAGSHARVPGWCR